MVLQSEAQAVENARASKRGRSIVIGATNPSRRHLPARSPTDAESRVGDVIWWHWNVWSWFHR